ncbi:MAG: glycine cleavage system protein GcvH [Pseudomonadota bacterium]
MTTRKYTEDHEWVDVANDNATIGITDYAQNALGDVVYVELPEVGATYEKGAEAGVVESVKTASEVYAPISGEVTAVNELLTDTPETVNTAAEADGWFFKMTVTNSDELDTLMDEDAYKAHVASLD